MKTAMQEFVDNNFYIDGDGEYILKWVEDTPLTDEINEALKKEKKQIIKAINYGLGNDKEIELGEFYYNKNYNQNKS
jgi:hypothetical protein